jgi:SWI/SNF-related matrix-associated actin-dependent regulator 1 of chromatin subfamily A
MRPNQFSSFWDFAQRYCDPYHDGFGWNFDGASNILELNERTRDLCIRRLKSEVLPELPPKTRTFIPVHLTRKERSPYDSAQDSWYQRIDSFYMDGAPLPKGIMLNMITDLRHICGQIKVNHAVDWVSEYHDQTGKPIVVFTHHRDVLARMAEKIEAKGMKVNTISGDTNSKSRQEIVDDFQANNIDVLICNTIAAKEGITLTAADTVLFIEREWVPTDEEQAEDRVYRIGQESQHVHAVYLSVAGTIDEHFDRVVAEKRAVVKAVLDGGNVEQRKGLVAELVKRLKQERGWEIK